MKEIVITNPSGITLPTKNTLVDDNIKITIDKNLLGVKPDEEYPNESVKYYKKNRNKNYPYFPLSSEITDEQDTIYMLYDASGYMCCPAFNVTFTSCVCTVQKYMNTTLVSESDVTITSGTTKYLQFSEEYSDYSTYNYIVIKLQGSITKHYLNYTSKFNGTSYNSSSSSELLEVSGKCAGCDIKVSDIFDNSYKRHQSLEYYSFSGVISTSMNNMFYNCNSLKTVLLDTSLVTDMSYMFYSCPSLQTVLLSDTSSVNDMSYMFYGCYNLKTVSLDTVSVTDMSYMLYGCRSLKTVLLSNTSLVINMSYMFYNCNSLQTVTLDTVSVINMSYMFYSCTSLLSVLLSDTSSVTNMSYMFYNCYNLKTVPLDTSSVINTSYMLYGCNNLKTVSLNTSSVNNMSYMLCNCRSLQTISLDASSAANMDNMFNYCYLLVKADITNVYVSFKLNASTMLSQSELVKILNNLATVKTTKTLTLGSTLLGKLTKDQKAIATAKGWTLT